MMMGKPVVEMLQAFLIENIFYLLSDKIYVFSFFKKSVLLQPKPKSASFFGM
ncbi:hypothetical protein MATR_37200 [Marivirga tractuosa]|uniref:Uncharacterized protein n=1 Tax=Marivirga tractuosa (strain ATCC 23168 / DSM 4126 / NBRC 15989 / NCIMB 1408 / VKM B-1430 / H-43) TaxID=643867 RepID=E4TN20_MARTH|nr:hypothetical protein Ftrac_2456 [Marivirga tractuosa DSM 4126]BDD16895.1 hypothetical protein MATR_37200 [Marivirga tractuosa]